MFDPVFFEQKISSFISLVPDDRRPSNQLAMNIFGYFRKQFNLPLSPSATSLIDKLVIKLQPTRGHLADVIRGFLRKDDCGLKNLPLDIKRMIFSYLYPCHIRSLNCFVQSIETELILRKIELGFAYKDLELSESQFWTLRHRFKSLCLTEEHSIGRILWVTTNLTDLTINQDQLEELEQISLPLLTSLRVDSPRFRQIKWIRNFKLSPHLRSLKATVSIIYAIKPALGTVNFANLTTLDLSDSQMQTWDFESVVAGFKMPNLVNFILNRNSINWGAQTIDAMIPNALPRLLNLQLNDNYKSNSLENILASKTLTTLTRLEVAYGNPLGFFKKKVNFCLTRLKALNCSERSIDSIEFESLMQLSSSLTELNMDYCRIGSSYRFGQGLTDLQTLNLSRNPVLDFNHFIETWHFPSLTKLTLNDNRLNDNDIRNLIQLTTLQMLTSLCLQNNRLTDEGVEAIIVSTNMQNLVILDVSNNFTRISKLFRSFIPGLRL